MRPAVKIISYFLLTLAAVSCSPAKLLQQDLGEFSSPVGYVHNSSVDSCSTRQPLALKVVYDTLKRRTTVKKTRDLFLPLILVFHRETNMQVTLGRSSLQKVGYTGFFPAALAEEGRRTGCFTIADTLTAHPEYTLDVTFRKCLTTASYQRKKTFVFLLFFYVHYTNLFSPASKTQLEASVVLRKGSTVILEKEYLVYRDQPFLKNSTDPERYNADFTANMVESLSLATKQCVEEMTRDIYYAMHRE